MKRSTFSIRCVFLFALAIFAILHLQSAQITRVFSASSADASSPPADDVHFCEVLDYEDRRARDSLYAATKHALNLNVGEPRTVRMIYFLPNDRPFRQEVVDSMKVTMRQIQTFYADQMEAHGYGRKTFRFETDAEGEPLIHRVDGGHPDSYYRDNTYPIVFGEVRQVFNFSANIYLVAVDNETRSIGIGNGRQVAGVAAQDALIPADSHWIIAAHELGHTFGLRHDFRDNAYIMSYGGGLRRVLSACNARFLAVHSYFDPDIPIEAAQRPSIEPLSLQTYSPGSKSISVQLKVSDSDGLHQVLLFVTTREPHSAAGFPEVKACHGLNGEREAIVELEYDGVIPSIVSTSLFNSPIHSISVRAVDSFGNVSDSFFRLFDASLRRNITTLEGHGGPVNAVSFSSDGTMLASGSSDITVKLWDVATRDNITTLEGHGGPVNAVSFSSDGTMLASGSDDETVKLWDVATRDNVATLEGYGGPVYSVAFSPDGTMLASGAWGIVELWEVATRDNIATLEGYGGPVYSVAFSPDGTMLASGSDDETVKLWDVATRDNIATLEGYGGPVYSVAFSPDGTMLASGSDDETVKLWDVATRDNIATLEGYGGPVYSVAFSPDGTMLASGAWGIVELWEVATRRKLATHLGQTSVSFSPDGTMLASGPGDDTIVLWDMSEWLAPRLSTLVKVSGDNQQGAPGAELTSPLIVELRDQYGFALPLKDVPVTFRVNKGNGRLNGKFTVFNVMTDAQGRAQTTLTPIEEINTVEVSVAGLIFVTFNAVSVATPAISIKGGDYQTWHLSDGAIARLGKGSIGESDRAVAFSPDGQWLAVASGIGIWLYDVATCRPLVILPSKHLVHSVVFSPDGTMLASGSSDRTVKLWDVATRDNVATLEGHSSWVHSVAFSPDGTMLASGSSDRTVKLWDVATRDNVATLEGHSSWVHSVAFSPDGTMLASGSSDRTVKLWDVATRDNIATLEGHSSWVHSVAFSPDGTMLASGSDDRAVKLWDVATRDNVATLEGHSSWVHSVAFSPDGTMLASGSSDRTVKLWDVATRDNVATLEGHSSWVHSVAFSPDGTMLASGARGIVELWGVETRNAAIISGHTALHSVAFSPDGTMLASGSDDRTVKLWDVATGTNIATLEGHSSWVHSVAFSPDGTMLASGSDDETVKLWDVATRDNIATLEGYGGPVYSVAFSSDGTMLASGARGIVELWEVATRRNVATLEGHSSWVHSVAFSPDGTMLASGSDDETVKLWDVATRDNIATLEGHGGRGYPVAFSPDGTMLASGSDDRAVKLWDVATRDNVATLEGHSSWVHSVAFSPDGTMLASGSDDRTVKLWDVATRDNVATLEGHSSWVRSVAFSPDGQTLASTSGDGTALLWNMSEYVTPLVYMPDANLRAVIRDALGKSRFAPITVTDMASLTALDARNRNIRELVGLEAATNLKELNLVDNPLSAPAINTHIPALQERGVEVLFDKPTTLVKISEGIQEGVSGAVLDTPLVIEVQDQNGNVLEGVVVTFSVTEGTGTLSTKTAMTDSSGRAQTMLTLGNSLETTIVAVTVPGIEQPSTFVIKAMATPDFDRDGVVGFADFLLFVAQFGFGEDDEGYDARFDLDGDGIIGFGDFLIFVNAFGKEASALEGSGG